jgi:hydrogenase 3 maturation protease
MAAGQAEIRGVRDILQGRVAVVGVGNRLRGDDAAGPLLIDRLQGMPGLTCVDAGSALENHVGAVIRGRPDTVLLVDAMHLGLSPGQYELLEPDRIQERGLSTHDLSLKLSVEVLARNLEGKVFMLGIQPRSVSFGSAVSDPVRRTLELLELEISGAVGSGSGTKSHRME